MTWLCVCIIYIIRNAWIILKTRGCFTNLVLSYPSTFSRAIYKRASLHVMLCLFSLCSMCISPTQVLATYICFLVVKSVVLGSPGDAKNCVNVNKYTIGKLDGFTGEQRAIMWEKNLGDWLTMHCNIYAAVQ